MIAQLTGLIQAKKPDHVVVDVGGVGYRVFVSLSTFYELPEKGAETSLAIHTVVREDAIHLYGFSTENEKQTFGILTGVSKIGPKLALGILSGITSAELWQAVKTKDTARLIKIPGIGKKTAARLLLELEGKLPTIEGEEPPKLAVSSSSATQDAISALTNLGYSENQADDLVRKAQANLGQDAGLEEILRTALRKAN